MKVKKISESTTWAKVHNAMNKTAQYHNFRERKLWNWILHMFVGKSAPYRCNWGAFKDFVDKILDSPYKCICTRSVQVSNQKNIGFQPKLKLSRVTNNYPNQIGTYLCPQSSTEKLEPCWALNLEKSYIGFKLKNLC